MMPVRTLSKVRDVLRAAQSDGPGYLIFFVTSLCNARCDHCFYWQELEDNGRSNLTLDEIRKIAAGFSNLVQLTISGGEPFLRPELPQIIQAFAQHNPIAHVTINTNGYQPDRILQLLEETLELNPGVHVNFCVSVDDIGAPHDQLRRTPDGFERLCETIKKARQLKDNGKCKNFSIHATTCITADNQGHIVDILKWIQEHLPVDHRELLLTRGSARDEDLKRVDPDKYQAATRYLQQSQRRLSDGLRGVLVRGVTRAQHNITLETYKTNRYFYPCNAGKKLVVLRHDGTVDPCEMIETVGLNVPEGDREAIPGKRFSLGNIRDAEYDIGRLLRCPNTENVQETIREQECRCTFECATASNLVLNSKAYSHVARHTLASLID